MTVKKLSNLIINESRISFPGLISTGLVLYSGDFFFHYVPSPSCLWGLIPPVEGYIAAKAAQAWEVVGLILFISWVYTQPIFSSSIPLLYVLVEQRCGCNFREIVFNLNCGIEHRHIIIFCITGETLMSLAELHYEIMRVFPPLDLLHFRMSFCSE